MPLPTAQDAAARWASRLAASTDRIQAGIQATTTSPGQAAARQKDAWAANVAASKDKWASRTSSVSLADWQQAAIEKGVPRVAAGAQAAQGKMGDFMTQLLPHIQSQVSSLPARGNLEQNINRMTQFTRGMAKFTRR